MEKAAYAIFKKGKVHIQAYAKNIGGGGSIAYGPVFTCALTDGDQIVRHLRQAFEYSIQGVPHPDREGWKEVQRPMLEAVGAKTWIGLAWGAKALGFELKDNILTIEPSSNYWNRGGDDMPEIIVPYDAPDLGKMIVRAFEISS